MEKVAGIGGLFFRAHDPKALGSWYQQHLGIALTPASEGAPVWEQEAGPTVFSPVPEKSGYSGDPNKVWMVNFRVHDLDKMVAQLRTAGIEVKDPESYPNIGRFARLHDPEGVWEPPPAGVPSSSTDSLPLLQLQSRWMCNPTCATTSIGHQSSEPGHQALVERIGLCPILNLSMRLGESTGAALAVKIVQAAAATLNEMATFSEAEVAESEPRESRT